jgi:hypothetical protein
LRARKIHRPAWRLDATRILAAFYKHAVRTSKDLVQPVKKLLQLVRTAIRVGCNELVAPLRTAVCHGLAQTMKMQDFVPLVGNQSQPRQQSLAMPKMDVIKLSAVYR